VVGEDYFTDRIDEQQEVRQILNSQNHLILISPRRFGKTSLIEKVY
jgi:AAA+ ATPase superfamily predicted ATPase